MGDPEVVSNAEVVAQVEIATVSQDKVQHSGTAAELKTDETSLSFIQQIQQLSDTADTASASQAPPPAGHQSQEDQAPEILIAYLSGQPEAVAAIELLREAQRIWDQRKRSITPSVSSSTKNQESSTLTLDGQRELDEQIRRYSHEDLRIAYNKISAKLTAAERRDSTGPLPAKLQQQQQQKHYRRRPSTQAESLTMSGHATVHYQPTSKNSSVAAAGTNRKRSGGNNKIDEPTNNTAVTPKQQRSRSRGSVDMVSQAMMTGGMASYRNSSVTDSTGGQPTAKAVSAGGRRASHHRLHGTAYEADVLLPLGTDAVSFHREHQRRRASSKASAIFLVSPSNKETQLVPEPEDEDDGSPEGRRRRRTISIIATVGAFLLVLSILMVTVTLRLATHIDDLGKVTFQTHSSFKTPLSRYLRSVVAS